MQNVGAGTPRPSVRSTRGPLQAHNQTTKEPEVLDCALRKIVKPKHASATFKMRTPANMCGAAIEIAARPHRPKTSTYKSKPSMWRRPINRALPLHSKAQHASKFGDKLCLSPSECKSDAPKSCPRQEEAYLPPGMQQITVTFTVFLFE